MSGRSSSFLNINQYSGELMCVQHGAPCGDRTQSNLSIRSPMFYHKATHHDAVKLVFHSWPSQDFSCCSFNKISNSEHSHISAISHCELFFGQNTFMIHCHPQYIVTHNTFKRMSVVLFKVESCLFKLESDLFK